jgi:hypothetical protein
METEDASGRGDLEEDFSWPSPVKNHLDRPHVVGIASETLYTASHEYDLEPPFFIPVGAPNPAHGRLL